MTAPLYLARRSYRRRRLRDAARILPVLGAALMVVPILLGQGAPHAPGSGAEPAAAALSQGARALGADAIWLFALWAAMVLAALVLSIGLHDGPDDPAGAPGDGP